jgi:hypothetical protein
MTRKGLFLLVAGIGSVACVAGTFAKADNSASPAPIVAVPAATADEAPPVGPRTGPARDPVRRPDDWRPRPPMAAGDDGPGPSTRPGAAERFHRMGLLLARMKTATFSPAEAGLIAVGGLKEDVQRTDKEVIADLEQILPGTKSLGLRNAIRLQLRDLYKATGSHAKVLEHLRAMVKENDEALAKLEASGKAFLPEPPRMAP